MSSFTPNISLLLTPADDTTMTFKEWRVGINGEGNNSNMAKIDAKFGDVDSRLDDITNEHLAPPATITIGCIDSRHWSVVDYCCPADSIVDDGVVFQTAVNALPPQGGKIVILEGEYTIKSRLLCNKSVVFEGMGEGTILNFNEGAYIESTYTTGYTPGRSLSISFQDLKINFVSGTHSYDSHEGISFVHGNVSDDPSRRKINMSGCVLTFTNNNFVRCANVFNGCDYVKITNSSISLINNAVPINNSYTPRINLVYDGHILSGDPCHYSEISNCDILCRGKVSDSYKAWACISKCSGTVMSNCNIALETCGSISEGLDIIDGVYLVSMSNCNIKHSGTSDVYMGLNIFNGNVYSSVGGVTYFPAKSIIVNNYFYNHTTNDIKVGLSGNGAATITGNRTRFSCVYTSAIEGTVKINNI